MWYTEKRIYNRKENKVSAKKLNAQELNWIKFLTGSVKENDLTPANKERLEQQRKRKQWLKPFGGGIVNAFGDDD